MKNLAFSNSLDPFVEDLDIPFLLKVRGRNVFVPVNPSFPCHFSVTLKVVKNLFLFVFGQAASTPERLKHFCWRSQVRHFQFFVIFGFYHAILATSCDTFRNDIKSFFPKLPFASILPVSYFY